MAFRVASSRDMAFVELKGMVNIVTVLDLPSDNRRFLNILLTKQLTFQV
jgi:hypothetical protein